MNEDILLPFSARNGMIPAEFFVQLPLLQRYTNQILIISTPWEFQGITKLGYQVIRQIVLNKSHNLGYRSFVNMAVAFFHISFSILKY